MRGIHLEKEEIKSVSRIIPAHAGNTWHGHRTLSPREDHPRSCGEYSHPGRRERRLGGSSPLMRGILLSSAVILALYGIIPAHAGNTDGSMDEGWTQEDHPRSCGEYCSWITLYVILLRIIPAHAGNTSKLNCK